MDKFLVNEKLESLRRSLQRIRDKCPENSELMKNDIDIQDIISLNLTRAVQTSVDIAAHMVSESDCDVPDSMGELFETLKSMNVIDDAVTRSMKSAVGFRNVAVHSYEKINWDIVFDICTHHLVDFKTFAEQIISKIEK